MNTPETQQQFIFYTSEDGQVKMKVFVDAQTIWCTQKMMAELFDVDVRTVNEHLKNIFRSGELSENAVIRKFRTTAADGKQYNTNFYNLDAVISVGYRVNSLRATQFRIWATGVLREYLVKGFVVDDERLKQGPSLFGEDYFQELLERVRSIRASERRIYLKLTDIFAECSMDYDPHSPRTKDFFASVQNKFHFAITGKTAAEIVYQSADSKKPHMGLTTFTHAPKGRVLASDAKVAKNYLKEDEIKRLERTISSFFDYIENLIENKRAFTMEDFAKSVNKFLEFNEFRVLDGKGLISAKDAEKKALKEYTSFNKHQTIKSDFEKFVKKTQNNKKKS